MYDPNRDCISEIEERFTGAKLKAVQTKNDAVKSIVAFEGKELVVKCLASLVALYFLFQACFTDWPYAFGTGSIWVLFGIWKYDPSLTEAQRRIRGQDLSSNRIQTLFGRTND